MEGSGGRGWGGLWGYLCGEGGVRRTHAPDLVAIVVFLWLRRVESSLDHICQRARCDWVDGEEDVAAYLDRCAGDYVVQLELAGGQARGRVYRTAHTGGQDGVNVSCPLQRRQGEHKVPQAQEPVLVRDSRVGVAGIGFSGKRAATQGLPRHLPARHNCAADFGPVDAASARVRLAVVTVAFVQNLLGVVCVGKLRLCRAGGEGAVVREGVSQTGCCAAALGAWGWGKVTTTLASPQR